MLRTCAVLVGVLLFTSSFTSFSNNAYSFFEGSPYQKWEDGVPTSEICKEGLELIFKSSNDSPACVKPSTVEKLDARGWGTIQKEIESSNEDLDLLRAYLAKTPECVELSEIIEDASRFVKGKQSEYDNSEEKDPKLASVIEQERIRLENAEAGFNSKCYPQLDMMDNYELPYDPDFEYCEVNCYKPIEDYILIPELIADGFNERDIDVRAILAKNYQDDPLYNSECYSIMEDYFKLRDESENWYQSGNDPEDYPHADFIVTVWHIANGVCGFANWPVQSKD